MRFPVSTFHLKFPVFIFLLAGDFQCLYFRYFQFLCFRYFLCQDFACFSNWKFLVSRFHLRFPVSIFQNWRFPVFFWELEISSFYFSNWRFPVSIFHLRFPVVFFRNSNFSKQLVGDRMQVDSDKSSGFETSKGVQLVTWSWLQNFNFPFFHKPQHSQN